MPRHRKSPTVYGVLLLIPFLLLSLCFIFLGVWQASRSYSPTIAPDVTSPSTFTSPTTPAVSSDTEHTAQHSSQPTSTNGHISLQTSLANMGNMDTDAIRDFSAHTNGLHGKYVVTSGVPVPEDTLIVSDRYQQGQSTWWLVARYNTPNGALPVVLGYGNRHVVTDARARFIQFVISQGESKPVQLTGRFYYDEPPDSSNFVAPGTLNRMSSAAIINAWHTFSDPRVFPGFIVMDNPPSLGLGKVSIPREAQIQINWLNIFYAVEWFLFAGFCPYMWFCLVKRTGSDSK